MAAESGSSKVFWELDLEVAGGPLRLVYILDILSLFDWFTTVSLPRSVPALVRHVAVSANRTVGQDAPDDGCPETGWLDETDRRRADGPMRRLPNANCGTNVTWASRR